jgi:transposase
MALTIVETRAITGGVDTHADTLVAAALDPIGGLLGVRQFPASAAGYASLLDWLGRFGTVCLVGIEGTGSYGAGLARHITAAGIAVVEVDRSDRQDRRRQGKSDPLDAVSTAARAAVLLLRFVARELGDARVRRRRSCRQPRVSSPRFEAAPINLLSLMSLECDCSS